MKVTRVAIFPINKKELDGLLSIKALPPVPIGVTDILFEEENRKATITIELEDTVTDLTPFHKRIDDWVGAVNEACNKNLGVAKLYLELELVKANQDIILNTLEDMGRIERTGKGIKRKGK